MLLESSINISSLYDQLITTSIRNRLSMCKWNVIAYYYYRDIIKKNRNEQKYGHLHQNLVYIQSKIENFLDRKAFDIDFFAKADAFYSEFNWVRESNRWHLQLYNISECLDNCKLISSVRSLATLGTNLICNLIERLKHLQQIYRCSWFDRLL